MTEEKPKIKYPCSWEYKIIGLSEVAVKNAAVAAFSQHEYSLTFSHTSRTGKYHSFSLACKVSSEDERNAFFKTLAGSHDIVTVL